MKYLCVLIGLMCGAAGCAPGAHWPPAPSGPPAGDLITMSGEELDAKIHSLERLRFREGVSVADKEVISALVETYSALQDLPPGAISERRYRNLIRSLIHSVRVLDDRFTRELQNRADRNSEVISRFVREKNRIRHDYLAGNYRAVIDGSLALQKEFGPDALSADLGVIFALSLARQGMLEEAVSIGEGFVHQNEPNPDQLYLKVKIAQWHLRLGHREQARRVRKGLAEHLDQTDELLRDLDRQFAEAGRPQQKAPEEEPDEAEDFYARIDELIERGAYDKAKILIIRKRISATREEELHLLDRAMEAVEAAEERQQAGVPSETAPAPEELRRVEELMEKERFEEAIEELDRLSTDAPSSPEYRRLREQAVEQWINQERNRAAKLFLTARDATDPSTRAALLREARDILNNILETYPSYALNYNVKSNIKVVEEELARVTEGR